MFGPDERDGASATLDWNSLAAPVGNFFLSWSVLVKSMHNRLAFFWRNFAAIGAYQKIALLTAFLLGSLQYTLRMSKVGLCLLVVASAFCSTFSAPLSPKIVGVTDNEN